MSKPSPTIIKTFSVASTLGAVLMSNMNGEPKLLKLQLQIDRAMKVFSRKVGYTKYWEISNHIGKLWERVAEKHNNEITEDEVPAFIEYLCMLVPDKAFKDFLGMQPYHTSAENAIRPEINRRVVHSVLELDEELNRFCGTKPVSLTKPKSLKVKVKKVRDKAKPKVKKSKTFSPKQQRAHEQRVKEKADKKKRMGTLKEMIAAIKAKNESK